MYFLQNLCSCAREYICVRFLSARVVDMMNVFRNIFNQEQTPKCSKTQSKARMYNQGIVVFSFSLKIVWILWKVDQSNGYFIDIQSRVLRRDREDLRMWKECLLDGKAGTWGTFLANLELNSLNSLESCKWALFTVKNTFLRWKTPKPVILVIWRHLFLYGQVWKPPAPPPSPWTNIADF